MVRIRKTVWKVVYVIGAVVAYNAPAAFLGLFLPRFPVVMLGTILYFLAFLVAVRTFRGRGEPIAPPRAWWRMTSRPIAGFVIGSLFGIALVVGVAVTIRADASAIPVWLWIVLVVNLSLLALLAALYLHSSVRLIRNPPVTVEEERPVTKWKPMKLR